MLRRLVSALIVLALSSSALVMLSTPAHAAKAKVTIKNIPTQTVNYAEEVTIKPRVSTKGVKVRSKTLTVTKQGKRIAQAKKSVKLNPGTYRVTTVVKYKKKTKGKYGKTKTKKKAQTLKVTKPKACATTSDYAKVKTVSMFYDGKVRAEDVDDVVSTAKDLRSNGKRFAKVTLTELRDIAVQESAQDVIDFVDYLYSIGYSGSDVWEIRDYALCKSAKVAEVTYIDGDAWHKKII